jgi:flavin-dependent dehydrogenase
MNNRELRPGVKRVAIIGAGPAGLTAAYTLLKKDKTIQATVIEADPRIRRRNFPNG